MAIVLNGFCSEFAIALDGSGTTAGMSHQPGILLAARVLYLTQKSSIANLNITCCVLTSDIHHERKSTRHQTIYFRFL